MSSATPHDDVAWMLERVSKRTGIGEAAILDTSNREPLTVMARRELILDVWGSGHGYSGTGRLLGMDHTTVMAAVRKGLAA